MNYNKFFDLAKEEGLDSLSLSIDKSSHLSFSFFNEELDSFEVADSFSISAKGLYLGKMGKAASEKMDKDTPSFLIKSVKENAQYITSDREQVIFKGSEKYHKKNVYNKELDEVSTEEKIELVRSLVKMIKEKEPRIRDVEASFSEAKDDISIINSYGLKLNSKSNYFYIYLGAIADDDIGETKTGGIVKLFTSYKDVNKEEMVKEAIEDTISQFNGKPCKTKKYKAVFAREPFASLLSAFLGNASAESIQKNTSLLKDKLNERIASKKLTVTENPLLKNPFFRYFDDEGVATYNKTLIKNGVINTYLYNLASAKKDNVETTANGYGGSTSLVNVKVKPGKLTEEQLFEKVGEGIYITEVNGLHAGLNPQSGNFSLQASGFMIKDGKKAEPVTLITISSNLFTFFKSIEEVGSNSKLLTSSYDVPSVIIKSISVSGD